MEATLMITAADLDAADTFAKKAMEKSAGAGAAQAVAFYRGYRKAIADLRGKC